MSNKANKKTTIGTIVSDKMDKVVTVQVDVQNRHPLYKKFVKRHKKVKARDEANEAARGDVVKMVATRPLSKETHWKVVEIIEKAQRG